MKIKVFSDMVCLYCYVGKLRLDQAIERLGLTDVEVEFKAFQLHPTSPSEYSMLIYDFIRQAYGPGAVGNPAMRAQVLGAGKSVDLDFNYDIMRSCNTKKAHRLCKWAGTYGKLNEMTIAVMDGYFTKGKELNHNEDLLEMVKNVGLDVQEAEKILNSDQYLEEVDADIREARMYGIQSVPFFIFENRLAVSGAQPVEVFMQALQKTQAICKEGTTCGPDGCCQG